MADTSRGYYPRYYCCDCGLKGCEQIHWGPLIPDGKRHSFCSSCFEVRRDFYYTNNNSPKPLPKNHVCKAN